jgi:hypothetical protein
MLREIETLRDEMKLIALALGRSKTDGESDCDWFDMAGDVKELREDAERWTRHSHDSEPGAVEMLTDCADIARSV